MNKKNTIQTYKYGSIIGGTNVCIFGSIHGNEPCGNLAIQEVMCEINSGTIAINKGSVCFIPVCNPQASVENRRFIEDDLARVFKKQNYHNGESLSYEKMIANYLNKEIEGYDAILDIHSGNSVGSTFIFQDYETQDYSDICGKLGFDLVVHGWHDVYNSPKHDPIKPYWIVVECGQHCDSQAVFRAKQAIYNFLAFYGIFDNKFFKLNNITKHIRLTKLHYMKKEGIFTQEWKNGDIIKKGEILAKYNNGESIISEADGYIILPKVFAKVGDERFYTAVDL